MNVSSIIVANVALKKESYWTLETALATGDWKGEVTLGLGTKENFKEDVKFELAYVE